MRSTRLETNRLLSAATSCLLAFVLFACDGVGDDGGLVELVYTFEEDAEDWTGHFADYPITKSEEEMELEFGRRMLPEEMGEDRAGLYFAGLNQSDDLFMFARRRISDLEPNTTYGVEFQVEIASNAPSGCVGIGGPPGEAVRVKVGAVDIRPEPVVVDGDYRLNVKKEQNEGEPGERGSFAEIGNIANGVEECTGEVPYRMITLGTEEPIEATADDESSLWVFVGTDSGFEGKTALYYDAIEVRLEPR